MSGLNVPVPKPEDYAHTLTGHFANENSNSEVAWDPKLLEAALAELH